MQKSLEEIRSLLETPEVREIIQTEIQEAVKIVEAEYSTKIVNLDEDKKSFEKETFITKKMLLAKSNLYEKKLQEYYQSKFMEAKEKLATEVFAFIQDSATGLIKSVKEDAASATKLAKIEEAFSQAVRAMAPHMNINELLDNKSEEAAKIKMRLNDALAENITLKADKLSEDIQALVINETTGYAPEVRLAITSALKKMNLKTMVEAKEAIDGLKKAINKEAKKVQAEAVTEAKIPASVKKVTDSDSKKLDTAIKNVKETKAIIVEEKKQAVKNSFKELRLPEYNIV